MRYLTQAEFMRNFNDSHREQFNMAFFERNNQDIMDATKKIILSCEKDKYFTLKVLEMREIYDYEEIYNMLREHEEKRRKKNAKYDNPYDFINIKDSDIMLLEVKYFIRHNGMERQEVEGGTIEVNNPQEILQVLIVLPRFARKYYFRLNGNYYTSTFQVVDGSTYNNTNTNAVTKKADCNTFKTMFMPVRIFRLYKDMVDFYSKSTVRNTLYTSMIFNNHLDTMYYIFANFGLYGAMDFMDIRCIRVVEEPIADEGWFNFGKHNLFVSYPKECAQDPMVQSFASSIYNAIQKDTTINDVFDIRFWIKNLGMAFKNASIDKGLFVLDSIDSIYDIITQEELHLPPEQKANIYCILRWLMREFAYIKGKDNVDVTLKRLRIAEYIAATYAAKLSKGIHRVSDMGKRVTLKSVIRAIYSSPTYVISNIINMSNLVAYRDMVNDNDGTVALKYTYKGISGLGEDGTSIQMNYRYVDPSHTGILDLDASTTSDPGMSGMICPMAKVYDENSFSQYQEPNFWEEKYKHYQTDYFNHKPFVSPIIIEQPLQPSYIGLREQVVQESLDIDKIHCPIFNISNPNAEYTSAASQINKEATEVAPSLFSIRKE